MKRNYNNAFEITDEKLEAFQEIVCSVRELCNETFVQDLLVEVNGKTFNCNKFYMATFSYFFRGIGRCEMKESKSGKVVLTNMSPETFDLILQMLKTHESLLTDENTFEVWQAANFLQIPLLIRHCERRIKTMLSLDTFELIYKHAHLYNSVRIREKVMQYMQKEFESLCKNDLFSFVAFEDFLQVVESDELDVRDEDIVLRAIFRWAGQAEDSETQREEAEGNGNVVEPSTKRHCTDGKNGDGSARVKPSKLCTLLLASRYGIASHVCIMELSKHPLLQKDEEATQIINEALVYNTERTCHGYWPPFALHRELSGTAYVGVTANNFKVSALDLLSKTWTDLPRCPIMAAKSVTVFKDQLYAVGRLGDTTTSSLYVFKINSWKLVDLLPGEDIFMVSKGHYIYTIDRKSSRVHCVMPTGDSVFRDEIETKGKLHNPESAIDFNRNILIFCRSTSDDRIKKEGETAIVYCLSLPTNQWSHCGHLQGPAKNLVSFRNGASHYILLRNGSLWQVVGGHVKNPEFIFIKNLWSFEDSLKGAFIHKDVLYLFGSVATESSNLTGVPGVFEKVRYWYSEKNYSNFVLFFLPEVTFGRVRNDESTQHR